MQVDLVKALTRDGVRLDGMLHRPAGPTAARWPIDALCLVHGTGGNFYSSTLFDALSELGLSRGSAVLRVNTRGHDGISTAVTNKGGRRLGAAYEVVDDCRHDIAAWVDWLKTAVGPRVALVGHSLGAVKCLYALAHEASLQVTCAVGISPPRLSYSWFCQSPEGSAFLQTFHKAEEQVQARMPLALLEVQFPLPFIISAGGYVEKYGPDERYNYLPLLRNVRFPTLITLGELEVANNMAFRGAPEAIADLKTDSRSVRVSTVAGADHFYSQARADLARTVDGWLSDLGTS